MGAPIAHLRRLEDIDIVLSLRDGQVWASWPDGPAPVALGEHDVVLAAMRDFIQQSEAADRLAGKALCGGIVRR